MPAYSTDYRPSTNQAKALHEIAYLASEIRRVVSGPEPHNLPVALEIVKDCVLKMNDELLKVSSASSVHEG